MFTCLASSMILLESSEKERLIFHNFLRQKYCRLLHHPYNKCALSHLYDTPCVRKQAGMHLIIDQLTPLYMYIHECNKTRVE